MTVATETEEVVHETSSRYRDDPVDDDVEDESSNDIPDWVAQRQDTWGELLIVPEWQDKDDYRHQNGWKGRDLIHDVNAPVRILQYFVKYGQGLEGVSQQGGVGTTLTGIVHFTPRAESHAGYCHGGSMCSVLDDIVGWCAFLVTGECKPWSGYTVQINTNLVKPIRVGSTLLVRAVVMRIERRKVFVQAKLVDPAQKDAVHAQGDGLVVLNRGVLPLLSRESTDSIAFGVEN